MSSLNHGTRRSLATLGLGLGVLTGILSVAPRAHAITDQERWAAHQELTQAQDLRKKGQLQDALPHYIESARVDPKFTTLSELAELEEQLGKLEDAKTHWAAARDKAAQAGAGNTKQRAEEHIAAIEKRTPHLTLQASAPLPAGSQVTCDGAAVDPASIGTAVVLNPGDHTIVVKAPGHADASFSVKLADGDNQTLAIAPGAASAPAAPAPPATPVAAPPPQQGSQVSLSSSGSGPGGSSRRNIGLVASFVGAAGVVVGVPLWYLGWRDSNSIGPDAPRNQLVGEIATIGGGALLVTGIVLLVTAPSDTQTGKLHDTHAAKLHIVPSVAVGERSTVVGAVGSF